jgi:hypothetical protein
MSKSKVASLILIGALLGGAASFVWIRHHNTEALNRSFITKVTSIEVDDVTQLGKIASSIEKGEHSESIKELCTLMQVQANRMRKTMDEAEPIFVARKDAGYEIAQALWKSQVSSSEKNAKTAPCASN